MVAGAGQFVPLGMCGATKRMRPNCRPLGTTSWRWEWKLATAARQFRWWAAKTTPIDERRESIANVSRYESLARCTDKSPLSFAHIGFLMAPTQRRRSHHPEPWDVLWVRRLRWLPYQ